ncbi:MAG TPA: ABC transporter ATP-binding protein [Alphaproteobacteria bacterium]|nr:ABC transporter ATP-binding protein [Alphaproteobacteria bacterium]
MPSKIDLRHVKKSFGSKHVLADVNLAVPTGETMVIMGGSGTGKSVLLKCILGLVNVDGGMVMVDGKDTTKLKAPERMQLMKKFGMLFQGGALFDSMTVWENVAFVPLQAGMKPADAKKLAIAKLAMVDLKADVADQNPGELSGGMRKRVALARAIAHEPEIIFYDEPTTGLDPITADVINDLIIKLQKQLKCTSVVITHDLHSAFKVADRMAMLFEGRVLAEGTPAEMKKSSQPFVQQFLAGGSN